MAEGRRERIRTKVRNAGLEILAPHEVVELILYPFVPRKDTSPLARKLLEEFGSLDALLSTKEEDLLKVEGMPKGAAFHIPTYKNLVSIGKSEEILKRKEINTMEQAQEFFIEKFGYLHHEEVHILCLDAKRQILRHKKLSEGGGNYSELNMRNIASTALATSACYVILAHNHPSGELAPSNHDIIITKEVYEGLNSLNIDLLDHIIVSKNHGISLRMEGYFDSFTKN